MVQRERHRERERERETDRQTHRHTHRQRQWQRERHSGTKRERERQTDRERERETVAERERETERDSGREREREREGTERGRETEGQRDRHTERAHFDKGQKNIQAVHSVPLQDGQVDGNQGNFIRLPNPQRVVQISHKIRQLEVNDVDVTNSPISSPFSVILHHIIFSTSYISHVIVMPTFFPQALDTTKKKIIYFTSHIIFHCCLSAILCIYIYIMYKKIIKKIMSQFFSHNFTTTVRTQL